MCCSRMGYGRSECRRCRRLTLLIGSQFITGDHDAIKSRKRTAITVPKTRSKKLQEADAAGSVGQAPGIWSTVRIMVDLPSGAISLTRDICARSVAYLLRLYTRVLFQSRFFTEAVDLSRGSAAARDFGGF